MPSEQEILKEIRKIIPNSKKYLFDDCAVIEKNLVITSDTIVENVHFSLKNYTPSQIGWKAMAVNLSDIASMGAKPLYAMVSLSLPKKTNLKFTKELYKGIQACAKKYRTQIIGGNLTSSKEISITVTLLGKALVKTPQWGVSTTSNVKVSLRRNAKPGDLVFCTGTFGDAALGYLIIHEGWVCKPNLHFFKALKEPTPQVSIGQKIVNSCNRVAMMDSSDGLADCLIQISEQSKVKIIVDENKIPITKEMKRLCKAAKKDPLNLALYGGEDYQLVGTISKNDYKKIKNLMGIKIIGETIKGKNVFLKQINNKLVKLSMNKSFRHFT